MRRVVTLLAALGPLAASGCGYGFRSAWSSDVRTVAVEIFVNDSFDRDVEFDLADALVKEIEGRTPYKVTSASSADTILTGRIRNVERSQLSKSPTTGLSEEVAFRVTIDVDWRDLRTGKPLLELESFDGIGVFMPSQPMGEPIELGRFAAVQKLARDIVDQMQADW